MWRVWANPSTSDIFIAARPVAGVEKVSLHESGDWRVQWVNTNDPGRRMADLTGSRILHQWRRSEGGTQMTPSFVWSSFGMSMISPSGM